MNNTARLLRNTFTTGTAQLIQVGVMFVLMPFLVDHFGLRNYGVFLLASSFSGYLGLLDLGVGAALTKLVAEEHARMGTSGIGDLISVGFAYYSIVGVAASGVLLVLAHFSAAIFGLPPGDAALMANLLTISAVGALFTWPMMTATDVLAGLQRYELTAMVAVVTSVLGGVATVAVLLQRADRVAWRTTPRRGAEHTVSGPLMGYATLRRSSPRRLASALRIALDTPCRSERAIPSQKNSAK